MSKKEQHNRSFTMPTITDSMLVKAYRIRPFGCDSPNEDDLIMIRRVLECGMPESCHGMLSLNWIRNRLVAIRKRGDLRQQVENDYERGGIK